MGNFSIKTKDDLIYRVEKIINVPFGYYMHKLDDINNKGSIGQMMEESYFSLKLNSRSEADFYDLNIELKVTPFIRTGKKVRSKERLVLNIINYDKENLNDFYDSSLWQKNKSISILFYEHNKNISRKHWFIDSAIIFNWIKKDMKIIENDWKIITTKIKNGLAHEISERDTTYLAACTKGSTAEKSYRTQPFSVIKAKQRAYSLKSSYISYILNNYVYSNNEINDIEKIAPLCYKNKKTNVNNLVFEDSFDGSIQNYILELVKPYIGLSTNELIKVLKIKTSKATNASIIKSILKIRGNIEEISEFQKARIMPKTIAIEANGSIVEHMSFPTFKFSEITQNEWEDSDFYHTLRETQFMFCVFRKDSNLNNLFFKGIYFWSMPFEDIKISKQYYDDFRKELVNGVKFTQKNNVVGNSFPKFSVDGIIHVRPHANKSCYKFDGFSKGDLKNADTLPNGDKMTKQCFWLNNTYLKRILEGILK